MHVLPGFIINLCQREVSQAEFLSDQATATCGQLGPLDDACVRYQQAKNKASPTAADGGSAVSADTKVDVYSDVTLARI